MKELGSLKINRFTSKKLKEREMRFFIGGCDGECGCRAENADNSNANFKNRLHVPGGSCKPRDYDGGSFPEINVTPSGSC